MEWVIDIVKQLSAGLGQAALVLIAFSIFSRSGIAKSDNSVWLGVLFGTGAVASMFHPIAFAPGISIDPRAVMLILAGPLGGPVATVITVLFATVARILYGGAGVYAGIVGIVIVGGVGLLYRLAFGNRLDLKGLAMLGALSASALLSLVVLPRDLALSILVHTGPWLVSVNFFGVILIGSVLSYELNYVRSFLNLKEEMDIDPLTGLGNRRVLKAVERELKEDGRGKGESYAVIIFDLDHFKSVNDRWGHDVGDLALCSAAQVIKNAVRRSDVVVRYGGEEMLVILRNATAEGALGIAETVRNRIAKTTFGTTETPINITISAGVAAYQSSDLSLNAAIKRADQALYVAKAKGRNRCEVFFNPRS